MQKSRKRIFSLITALLFCCVGIYAQQKAMKGTVIDTGGEPLVGVTISVKGNTTLGAMTDIDGKYELSVPGDAKILVASCIGMKQVEKEIKGTEINFTMEDELSALDEVVVIGYGVSKKRDLTGPISSVQGAAIEAVPVSNVVEALTGKLAGVQITTTEGSPDAELKIRVRGGGSISQDNSPLYIVDGFPVRSINDIPSSDIQSIDVLKDASTTAIYGSKGANGVIIVTTKSAKEGKMSVNYNMYYGVKNIAKTLNTLSVPDYMRWQYEVALLKNEYKSDSYEKYMGLYQDMDLYNNVKGNNWQELVYGRTGHVFNHNLSISAGSDKTSYSFNYSFMKDKAIMIGSDFNRHNLTLKLTHKPSKKVTLDFSSRFSTTGINGGGMNEQNEKSSADSRLKHTIIYTPLPLKNIGSDGGDEEFVGELVNPYVAIADNERKQGRRTLNMGGSAAWKAMNSLILKSEVGIEYYDATDSRFYGSSTYYVKNIGNSQAKNRPAATLTDRAESTIRNTNTANYDFKDILKNVFKNENHSGGLLVGQEFFNKRSEIKVDELQGFPIGFTAADAFKYSSLATLPLIVDKFLNEDDKMLSFFTRANYGYKDKYLFSATLRADGSSRFLGDNSWGYFPSVSGAWRLTSEPFMANTKTWLDDLKWRASFGTAGNNNIPVGSIRKTLKNTGSAWLDGFNSYIAPLKVMANPELKWETTVTRNTGLDFSFLNSKVYGSVDFYINNTKDLLIEFPIAGVGYDVQYRNMGETQNKGVEIQLNYNALNTKNFGLDFGFNIGFNKNKIKDLGIMKDFTISSGWASTEILDDYRVAVGGSVGEMYGYKSAGRYEVSDFDRYDESAKKWILKPDVFDASPIIGAVRPGMMKLESAEKSVIGNANPLHTGGFTINSRVYAFDISAAFNWSYGNDIYNANKIEYTSTSKYQYRNMIDIMSAGNRWNNLLPDGTISNNLTQLAEMNQSTTMWSPNMSKFVFSDWAVEDGSFLRLNTLTLGYTLPTNVLGKALIKSMRVYGSAYNVFCLTNYSGFDPEVSTRRKTNLTPGVDYSAYPKSRQFLFGVNLSF